MRPVIRITKNAKKISHLMEQLLNFLDINMNQKAPTGPSKIYKCGILSTEILENIDGCSYDPITMARILYVKNLVMIEPTSFAVPLECEPAERALMFLSFNDFKSAIGALGLPLESEVIGAEAVSHTGAISTALVLNLKNTESAEYMDYSYELLNFKSFKVQPLTNTELLFIYIKICEMQHATDHCDLAEFHLPAYINRALFEGNAITDALRTAFLLKRAEITNEIYKLEPLADVPQIIQPGIFASPITFASQIYIQTGTSHMHNYDYGAAYEILQNYPLYDNNINCLIALKKTEEAAKMIKEYIGTFDNVDERHDQLTISNLYIKLGHIYQDPKYFDIAASFFHSSKPFQLKGLWYFKHRMYNEAEQAFMQALAITPNNEEIRYSYGCTLVELDKIPQALKVFRCLKAENMQNENISKNLSYCYYKLKDIENTLSTLRTVALRDSGAMKQYLYLSVKNNVPDNVRWALQRVGQDESLKQVVKYLISNQMFSCDELRAILQMNQYLEDSDVENLLVHCSG